MICGTDPRPPGSALSGGSRLRDSFCISWLLSSLLVVGPLVSMLQATPPPPPGKLIQSYALVSANDFPQRDPLDWRLLASNDGGKTWRTLDSRKNELFSERHQRRVFKIGSPAVYETYRLQIDHVRDRRVANSVQLAEIALMGNNEND